MANERQERENFRWSEGSGFANVFFSYTNVYEFLMGISGVKRSIRKGYSCGYFLCMDIRTDVLKTWISELQDKQVMWISVQMSTNRNVGVSVTLPLRTVLSG